MNRRNRRRQEALGRNRKAASAGPNSAAVLFAQAGAAFQHGRIAESEALLRETIRLDPAHADAYNWLGIICQRRGALGESLKHLNKAVSLAPHSPDFVNNLGLTEMRRGRLEAARQLFEKAVGLNPKFVPGHLNLGLVFKRWGNYEKAADCFKRAVTLAPDSEGAHLQLGDTLRSARKFDDAIRQYKHLIGIAPRSAEAWFGLARTRRDAMRFEEAAEAARHVLSLDWNMPQAHNLLGSIMITLGRFDEARARLETALALRPGYPEAFFNLSVVSKDISTPATVQRIEASLAGEQAPEKKALLHFVLGKIYDDLGEYAEAFAHYKNANDLSVAECRFDASRWNAEIARRIAVFTPSFFSERRSFGSDSRRPVFIFGMPRSGTTLVEQIIGSHSKVTAGGELNTFATLVKQIPERLGTATPYPDCLESMDAGQAKNLCGIYLAALDEIDCDASRVTDKMPFNFQELGLIALLFPNAAFIHCRREPLDTCLSCYFAKFERDVGFSFRLEDIGAYFRGYRRLMDHWRKVLPAPMLEVDYEELIENQEDVSRRMIAHCGLDWEPQCLQFQNTERAVATASRWQARQPIYKTSVERWRRYEAFVGPLRDALGEYGKEPAASS